MPYYKYKIPSFLNPFLCIFHTNETYFTTHLFEVTLDMQPAHSSQLATVISLHSQSMVFKLQREGKKCKAFATRGFSNRKPISEGVLFTEYFRPLTPSNLPTYHIKHVLCFMRLCSRNKSLQAFFQKHEICGHSISVKGGKQKDPVYLCFQ